MLREVAGIESNGAHGEARRPLPPEYIERAERERRDFNR